MKYFYLFVASLSSFGVGAFLIFTVAVKDIKFHLSSFRKTKRKKEEETFKQLKYFVESFSHLKQLSVIELK